MNEFDPLDLEGQEQASKKAQDANRLAKSYDDDDFKWFMSNKRGRRIMYRWLEKTGIYRTSFNHSGSVTAFNEGSRNIGLQFLHQIHEICPEHYLTMLLEAKKLNDN